MKNILYATALLVSFNSFAEFKLTFNPQTPKQEILQNGLYKGFIDLNLQMKAELGNDEDYPDIASSLSYQMSCEGDEPMLLRQDAKTISGSYSLLNHIFIKTYPIQWKKWPVGSRECALTWKGIATSSANNEYKTLALSATDFNTSVIYDDSPVRLTFEQRNLSAPKKHTFMMTKPEERYLYSAQHCINLKTATN